LLVVSAIQAQVLTAKLNIPFFIQNLAKLIERDAG